MRPSQLMILTVLILVGVAIVGAPVTPKAFGQGSEHYVISGHIEVLDKGEGIAVINGLVWPLSEDFSDTDIVASENLFRKSRTELRHPIEYYVIVQSDPHPIDSRNLSRYNPTVKEIPYGSPDIKTIHDKGGKVYKIYIPPS